MGILSNGYRFEAEALALSGYRIESSSILDTSSEKFIGTKQFNSATGKAYGKFAGEPGTYRVEVGYYDENDGQSLAQVTVAGKTTQFRFDEDLGSSLPAADTHAVHVTHPSITLRKGDSFSIFGKANGSEFARFDYLDFIRLDPANPPPPPSSGSAEVDPSPPASSGSPGVDPSPPASGANAGLDAFEAEVVRLVNEFRAQNGKKALTANAALSQAAEEHSEDMALNDFFSHTGSDGSQVAARVSEEGYNWRSVGENIAAGQSTPKAVVDAWIASSGHRANMLGTWDDLGVGYEYLSNDTGSVNYHHYWTTDFGLA